ncbi:MAG: gluconate 2-dehydrogenase subunit 3 family protein [Saprospiraceae bacterium]
MDRRDALRRVALLTGAAISAPFAAAFLQSCESGATSVGEDLQFFTQNQFDVLNEIAERIMPKTDTPGAKDVKVVNLIDGIIADYYSDEDAKGFAGQIDTFETDCKKANSKSFTEMSDEERDAYLTKVEAAAHKTKDDGTDSDKIFWFNAKQGVLSTFFMTEEGCTQVLQHKAIPGPFQGCVAMEEAGEGRAWASEWV